MRRCKSHNVGEFDSLSSRFTAVKGWGPKQILPSICWHDDMLISCSIERECGSSALMFIVTFFSPADSRAFISVCKCIAACKIIFCGSHFLLSYLAFKMGAQHCYMNSLLYSILQKMVVNWQQTCAKWLLARNAVDHQSIVNINE